MANCDRSAVRHLAWVLGSAFLAVAGCATGPAASPAAANPATARGGELHYRVSGAVFHPGAYSLADGRKITLKQAVISAGLPDPVPADGKVALICPGPNGSEGECDVFDLSAVLTTPAGDRELIAGEVIVVRTPLPVASPSAATAPAATVPAPAASGPVN
jgi:hypothetical protein